MHTFKQLSTISGQLIKCHMGTTTSPHIHYNKSNNKQNFKIMSTLHHEDMLLQIFDEVCEAFPYLDEEKQIEIANNRFQELCQQTTTKS